MIFKDGNFKRWARTVIALVGLALIAIGLKYDAYWVYTLGMVIGAVGMYAAKAAMVGIKPFSEKPKSLPNKSDSNIE